jgi:hypothetical protein
MRESATVSTGALALLVVVANASTTAAASTTSTISLLETLTLGTLAVGASAWVVLKALHLEELLFASSEVELGLTVHAVQRNVLELTIAIILTTVIITTRFTSVVVFRIAVPRGLFGFGFFRLYLSNSRLYLSNSNSSVFRSIEVFFGLLLLGKNIFLLLFDLSFLLDFDFSSRFLHFLLLCCRSLTPDDFHLSLRLGYIVEDF